MSLLEVLALSIALGTDAFSVAVVCGVQQFANKSIIQISAVIAIFHIIMPLVGIYGGRFFQDLLLYFFNIEGRIDHVLSLVGSGLLMLVGFYMIIERWLDTEEELCNFNVQGWGLMVLAFSVSIDSLSVGISLGMLGNINVIITFIIGAIAGIMMGSGLYFGSKLGHFLGEKAQMFGGIALILLGIHYSGIF
ncbi:MAG: manganese efflux pump MntP family protein [Halanaerobiaceae bacterium]